MITSTIVGTTMASSRLTTKVPNETVYLVLKKEYAHGPKWIPKSEDYPDSNEYSKAFKSKSRATTWSNKCNTELKKYDTDPASCWKAYPVEVDCQK